MEELCLCTWWTVADHGPGIDAMVVPDVALKRGYTTAVSLGMGYEVKDKKAADRVYLAAGSSVTMV